MKWILLSVYFVTALLVASIVLAFVYFEETKPYADLYGNHAGVLGLFVSIIGFALTVWTVYETLKVSTKAQKETAAAVNAARKETKELLEKVRTKMMGETCEQALFYAMEARKSVGKGNWPVAVERCHDARYLATRLFGFREITDAEREAIRTVLEDLKSTIAFME